MIRVLFKQMLDEKSILERYRITLNEVSQESGISRAILTCISNIPGYNTNADTLDTLCWYFECTLGDFLELRDDED